MLTDNQCRSFRPLGQRLLVQRYPLQEQSRGGVVVLGRDFPTMGKIITKGTKSLEEFNVHDEVQWAVSPDFDSRCVIGPDWLCLEADDINVRIDPSGIARAVGNRVLLEPTETTEGLLSHVSPIIVNEFHITRWALGRIISRGHKAIDWLGKLDSISVIYNPAKRSELRFNNQQYYVVRDEDCIAMVEE